MTRRQRELALAASAGREAATSLRKAVTQPKNEVWDHDFEQAYRMSRAAAEHAFKARPDLRPPDSYELARREAKDGKWRT